MKTVETSYLVTRVKKEGLQNFSLDWLGDIISPIKHKVTKYFVKTKLGTELRPYGRNHAGSWDSELFEAPVYGWVECTKVYYDSKTNNGTDLDDTKVETVIEERALIKDIASFEGMSRKLKKRETKNYEKALNLMVQELFQLELAICEEFANEIYSDLLLDSLLERVGAELATYRLKARKVYEGDQVGN